jgi:asparagine synthetase B (glutamine-hydrolysing)
VESQGYSPTQTVVLGFNGEIYNPVELRADLEGSGHRFRSNCDTELAHQAFIESNIPDFERFPNLPDGHSHYRYLFVDQHFYLLDDIHYKCDRISMAHSLEVRPPFLDHRIVSLRLGCRRN